MGMVGEQIGYQTLFAKKALKVARLVTIFDRESGKFAEGA